MLINVAKELGRKGFCTKVDVPVLYVLLNKHDNVEASKHLLNKRSRRTTRLAVNVYVNYVADWGPQHPHSDFHKTA